MTFGRSEGGRFLYGCFSRRAIRSPISVCLFFAIPPGRDFAIQSHWQLKRALKFSTEPRLGKWTIRFWGVRGSIPVSGPQFARFGGHTSCVELRHADAVVILDAGTGIRALGNSLMEEFGSKPRQLDLLLSHLHWDHIQGFPFFQPAYHPGMAIRIRGPAGRSSLRAAFRRQMESPFFPVQLRQLPSRLTFRNQDERPFRLRGLHVQPIRVNHPDGCLGYRVSNGTSSLGYFPDHEMSRRLPRGVRPVLEDARLVTFLRGLDLLIMDAQYDASTYPRHVGWGHGCLEDVVRVAARAEVRELQLFHHDPEADDAMIESKLGQARKLVRSLGSRLRIEAAREGAMVHLR